MENKKVYRAIGLMSGTSLDGVDIALIETDGFDYVKPVRSSFYAYSDDLRMAVKACFGQASADQDVVDMITQAHVRAVRDFGERADIIGFHGQTIFHDPDHGVTVQIGDGQVLADACTMPVVFDLRSADVAAGGQGAPLLPLYHRARALQAGLDLPAAIVNIGGVSNVTWIGGASDDDVLAFDCGPGNALLDDFVKQRTGQSFDQGGALAKAGKVNEALVAQWMAHPYFDAPAPKSLDRDAWDVRGVQDLSDADGAASLSAFTAAAILESAAHLPQMPAHWYISGGGRHNDYVMGLLRAGVDAPVDSVDVLGWDGDSIEAEGFAYLAVRSLLKLPISAPGTTGAPSPMTGGRLALPAS
ncbi:MAG: anhydro-N-acetylmuramic acid kinase [Alphaproteobacteria bacterium]|nr:anhydro-N-acetylmuramic acid kinase [Alphaproteobacteria bacterium]|tara:strand:+ start:14215 stop:15288 length:1074 start_codon:yes stop_codon:yes gene_type:complete